jgi:phosphoserine phosphatase
LSPSHRDSERPWAGDTPASGVVPLIPPGLDAVLVLVRHGETEFIVEGRFQGQMETPLTKRGELQLGRTGHRVAHPHNDPPLPIPETAPFLIAHSPLGRARRSAEILAAALAQAGRAGPPLRPEPGLLEIGQGEWEGLTDVEISAHFGDSLGAWRRWPERAHAPGGESLEQVRLRVEATLANLLEALADGGKPGTLDRNQVLGYADDGPAEKRWALLVGHGGVFRVVICVLLGLPMEHFWNFDFGLGGVSVIEIRGGRAVLRGLNLDPPGGEGGDGPGHKQDYERNARGAF